MFHLFFTFKILIITPLDSIYALTDLRIIFRKSSPQHNLNDSQKKKVKKITKKVRKNLDYIQKAVEK
ncbi:hypothetical protein AKJ50_01210 [candidate division MSBL1 archaeon SCGC-AAA382A13]|uniref:Uncharacterized protein n=1 Tax=candidate division MSBL1 archaeon SCGC-AAA382A13 TaxID=1698279 RepID=A0A133VFX8_9EURY|nr:hypothetical protein AKJ50_01210 [candidate division MSBL1 archaeon SCGC-AAA382A13]